MTAFKNWLKRRDENFGGSAGDVSGAGLNQPENGEREVTVEPNSSLDGSDKKSGAAESRTSFLKYSRRILRSS